MKAQFKTLLALAVLAGFASQAYAFDNQQGRGQKPERPSFTSIDLNGDGEVDMDEFLQHELPHGYHQTVFSFIDLNEDGVISEQEFTDHKPPRPKKR
ncbi:hypothetical protein A9Q74_01415 [Colwellia sp. 39_35_sub15_T18]|nr:hypothetical protein A9Q74_01415 [Colwellia sp. 39_35_sub15_T18]